MLGDLALQMKAEPFYPDVVVGVANEGSIVGSLFACNWRFTPFCALERVTFERDGATVVEVLDTIGETVQGRRVLLIDSSCNTGQTMTAAKNFLLRRKSASEVRTMVLRRTSTSNFRPDYFALEREERPDWPWVWTREFKERRRQGYRPFRGR